MIGIYEQLTIVLGANSLRVSRTKSNRIAASFGGGASQSFLHVCSRFPAVTRKHRSERAVGLAFSELRSSQHSRCQSIQLLIVKMPDGGVQICWESVPRACRNIVVCRPYFDHAASLVVAANHENTPSRVRHGYSPKSERNRLKPFGSRTRLY
jgi:hypothetical protein